MLGKMFKIILVMGKDVIKDEVLKWIILVVLVYIVVYINKKIGEIVLVLNFIWEFKVFEEKDYMVMMEDV